MNGVREGEGGRRGQCRFGFGMRRALWMGMIPWMAFVCFHFCLTKVVIERSLPGPFRGEH